MTTGEIEIQALLKEINRYKKAFKDIRAELNEWLDAPCLSESDNYRDEGVRYALTVINEYNPNKAESEDKG